MQKPTQQELLKIVSLITKISEDEIKPESDLRGDLNMDSLAALDLVVEIEEQFELIIDQEKVSGFTRVKDLYDYVDQLP